MWIKYSYKEYIGCPKATFVDKHTHKPSSCFLIGFSLFLIIILVMIIIRNCTSESTQKQLDDVYEIVFFILLVTTLIFSSFLPLLSTKLKWADKIAEKELEKNKLKPSSNNSDENRFWECPKCGIVNNCNSNKCRCGAKKPKY